MMILLKAENEMINRFYKQGQKLDVAGLNEITVLIDRSETELTEIGWNCWTPNQDGPPHRHNDKSQIFYVTNGVGKIHLGKKVFDAKPGSLACVPAGLVHQTITTTEKRLCYILFNVFLNSEKEGHSTFADHIEKVKQIRKRQAVSGKVDADNEETNFETRPGKFYKDLFSFITKDTANLKITLLDEKASRIQLKLLSYSAGESIHNAKTKSVEQTFFVLRGKALLTIENDTTEKANSGNVFFIPGDTAYDIKVGNEDMLCLCLSALID
ncbi:cupin domain-containing protein [candidate division KSB1 bacterium]|nr:cupin domain-containing protein [candidate division KSB1 bacterium]